MSVLSSLMGNPSTAGKLKELANSFINGNDGDGISDDTGSALQLSQTTEFFKNDKNINLLNAITPYLNKNRAAKVNSAVRALKMISVLSSVKW